MTICKECFHSYVCEKFNERRECDNKRCHFANDHFVSADLINRQKAEMERLTAESQMADGYADALEELAKAEAVKEFAERLKLQAYTECSITGYKYQVVPIEEIDNLEKEFTEGKTDE